VFNIVSCETCGFVCTSPRPEEKELGKFYESPSYISHTNRKDGLFNWLYQTIRKYSIKQKVANLQTKKIGGSHLDIGCGTGEFLHACKQSGLKVKGIEPSDIAINKAIKKYNLCVTKKTKLSQFKKNEFDSISMWHALEHIPNLTETSYHLNRILKPEGLLIIGVPNHKSWDAEYYKEFWAAWDVPIHLWHFSKETIKRLFENNGFKQNKIKPMFFDAFYVSLLSEEYKLGKKNYIKSFAIGAISNLFGILTNKGFSSVIYVFQKKNDV
jgi:ubiquinone/menaquinone biosynthesis C-methylase UbiE